MRSFDCSPTLCIGVGAAVGAAILTTIVVTTWGWQKQHRSHSGSRNKTIQTNHHPRHWYSSSRRSSTEEEDHEATKEYDENKNDENDTDEAYEIEQHILTHQQPAKHLGIYVISVNEQSLLLGAPLERNRNVHGTAFAGSLYSVAVLSSYYLGRSWLLRRKQQQEQLVEQVEQVKQLEQEQQEQQEQHQQQNKKKKKKKTNGPTLVAKTGWIRYKKPVSSSEIIAKSTLPSSTILQTFYHTLHTNGKATMNIDGQILMMTNHNHPPCPLPHDNQDQKDHHHHHHHHQNSIPPKPSPNPTTITTDDDDNNNNTIVVACEYSIEVCAFVSKE